MPRRRGASGDRVGRTLPYLGGPTRAAFDRWLEDAVARQMPPLEFREIRKGVQALSALYVQRREGADLASRAIAGQGKRAALATYYAPLHFLTAWHAIESIGADRLGAPRRILDLGCGTGALGAALGAALGDRAEVLGVDRSGFVLSEARRAYAAFGVLARTRRARIVESARRAGAGDLVALGWVTNELPDEERNELLRALRAALEAGAFLLLLEPLAGGISPWWSDWVHALAPHGIEAGQQKSRLALPEWVARLDRAAGLDHRVVGARWLAGPLSGTPAPVDPG